MPIFWLSLAVITGIVCASLLNFSSFIWFLFGSIFFLVGILEFFIFRNKHHPLLSSRLYRIPVFFFLCAMFIGGARFQSSIPEVHSNNLLHYVDYPAVTLTGVIRSDPNRTTRFTTAILQSESIAIDGKPTSVEGDVALLFPSGFDIRYGDRLKMTGRITRTFSEDTLPTTSYLARNGRFVQMAFPEIETLSYKNGSKTLEMIYALRHRAQELIFDIMPFPESAVLSGILLGKEGNIPEYLWNGYLGSGTAHIIAISGFNISIISILLARILRKMLGWKKYMLPTAGLIIFYTILVGADPPVVRAAIMGLFSLPAYYLGRRTIGIHNLSIAAAVMLLINPFILWSPSFQLSFIATLTLFTLVGPFDTWITRVLENRMGKEASLKAMPIINILISSLLASWMVFPILFKMNGNVSMIGLISNLFILPLQPLIMLTGGLAVMGGFIFLPLGKLLGAVAWLFLSLCDQIAIRFSLSNASVIPMPMYAYWIGLAIMLVTLTIASLRQVFSFSQPKIREP